MTAVVVDLDDLTPFVPGIDPAKAAAMIADAMATATLIAPCITDAAFLYPDAAKAIIRGAIIRWDSAGSGALATEQTTAGPFARMITTDTRTGRGRLFLPVEISALQKLCITSTRTAFAIDTASYGDTHSSTCALRFGASYCSCGADIAGFPIFGPP